jgi:hypothetical protein
MTLISSILVAALLLQTPPADPARGRGPGAGQAAGQGGRGGGGPSGGQVLPFEDHAGFEQIFDGTTMKNWDGDPAFWRVENGALVAESTAEKRLTENTFLIYRGGEPADFELKLEFRINNTNSGIQIRSQYLPQGTQTPQGSIAGKWVLKGYQADIDFGNQFTGQIYEERGRGFLALRGQIAHVTDTGAVHIIGTLQRNPDDLKNIIKVNDWNQVHLIARGNTIIEVFNGSISSIVIDDDTKGRALSGLIGFQMHVGDPMKVEFRNIWLKKL